MKRLIPLIAILAWTFSAWAVNYPDTTTSVVLQYTGGTVNFGKFGSITNTQQIEVTPIEARQLIGDSRFAVIKINGVSSATWYTAAPEANVIGWPGWLCWDATNNNLYAKDTGEGTSTGWILVSGGGSGAQTPWATAIDGAGFSLTSAKISGSRIEGAMTNAAAVELSTTTLGTGTATLSYTNGGAYRLTLSADTTLTLANATGTNRNMALEVYPDGTHVINIPSTVVALTATNQPFGVGRTTLYFSYLDGTNYVEVTPAPSTGAGKPVNQTSPTLVAPVLGVATATTINKMAITAPATSSTLAVADGKTAAVNNSLTLAGTDSTTITFQATDTYVGRATTDTFTNKTLDSQATGNVLKFLDYKDFVYPHRVDGTGATILTNDYTSALSGLATFAGTGGTNVNYAIFRIGTQPLDLDTGTTMKLRNLAIRVSGTDTGSASFSVGYFSAASSSAYSPTDFTALTGFILATTGTLTSPAANDIFYLSDITLTGWASGLTAGRPFLIGIARDGSDANNDSITIVGGTIEYGRTQ